VCVCVWVQTCIIKWGLLSHVSRNAEDTHSCGGFVRNTVYVGRVFCRFLKYTDSNCHIVKAKLNLADMGNEKNEAAVGFKRPTEHKSKLVPRPLIGPYTWLVGAGLTHADLFVNKDKQMCSHLVWKIPPHTVKMFKTRKRLATIFFRVARFWQQTLVLSDKETWISWSLVFQVAQTTWEWIPIVAWCKCVYFQEWTYEFNCIKC
jgi:hypothetical protein